MNMKPSALVRPVKVSNIMSKGPGIDHGNSMVFSLGVTACSGSAPDSTHPMTGASSANARLA